jgi:hypothetical protein
MALTEPTLKRDGRLEIASVVDKAYLAIRDRIADGTLARGARLRQEDLAAELGVSRTPVREARCGGAPCRPSARQAASRACQARRRSAKRLSTAGRHSRWPPSPVGARR